MKKDRIPFISAVLGAGLVAGAAFLGRKRRGCEKTKPESSAQVSSLKGELRNRMTEFLEQDRFLLVIQPVVNFQDNTVLSGEVLSRLNHPECGMIYPDEFLPVVIEQGLYPRFDRYIFRKCCAWLSGVLAEGREFRYISCNLSRVTLSEAGIAEDLIRIADRYGIDHSALALEITEGERATDPRQFLENLNRLKDAGFRIFLDDYGNGVTSLNDLMCYPLDVVKIDRSMLLKAETEQGAANFRKLVSTARGLGAQIVCEGIETAEQDRFARETGCHYGQGYLYFKPVSQSQIFDVIARFRIPEEEK